ncbi:oxidoreductase [Thauera sp. CAU 1555]|uniref:Oxidoreductase n=1 Tax=Thauera sedimentorum TaxID=2767595 RepID=A0ABR9BA41_9RHOO|nr:oxidoreductase-like domain-containing protein [Thauera sedimentorum]MBC9071378.1 oxidoreductase [Thauera sedimentorum]MBD8502297.1 oxidoreductase [Thauera sedimentorum]MDX5368305.1 oxidoreductase-like domain-containing protein [Alphaproteobacteria bacterium]
MDVLDPFTHRPANLDEAQGLIAAVRQRLEARGIAHRAPPPVPTSCCGRGCHGCVWTGYFEALSWWREDARRLLG